MAKINKIQVTKGSLLLASAAAGLMTLAVAATPGKALADDQVNCYGVNKCKGTGECGGKGHSCAGHNECAGQGWIKLDKAKCLKIKGGRLTPEKEGE
jgi:uncharacterized membrane protein